jgi:hypothetical protein
MENLLRVDPDDQKAETLPTKVWLWYDEENLYAQYECKIDNTFTPGKYAERDSGTQGDYVYFVVMTNPQAYHCYIYQACPTGTLSDGTRDLSGTSYDWNSSYSYTTEHNDSLWTIVFKVPFKDLRFAADPPYKWKVKLSRTHESIQNSFSYPYYAGNNPKDYYLTAADIVMTHKIKKHTDWKFRPYYIKSYDLVNKTDTFDPDNVGLDISFNPDTRTKAKITLNPDFTDVPPDDASNIYNEKYPVYYSENRFFFVEDIVAFGIGTDQFYTRNIVQPQFAAKITGATDIWTYGYLCAKDKKFEDSNDDFYQLMAVKKKTSNFMVHSAFASRMNTGYYNHFISGDWDWEFIPKMHLGTFHIYSMKQQDASSDTQEIDKQGLYQWVYLDSNPGNWNIFSSYSNLQKDVALDMGYLYETGFESYSLSSTWTSDPKERYVRSIHYYFFLAYSDRLEPNRPMDYFGVNSYVMMSFLPRYFGMLSIGKSRRYNDGKEHDTYGLDTTWGWYKYPAFKPGVTLGAGKTLIYNLNESREYYNIRTSFSGRVKRNLSWSASLTHYDYDYAKEYYIYTPTDTLTMFMDNSYQIVNAALDYNLSNQITTTTGLGWSTYQICSRYSNLNFYSNFRYEFKKDWFLYLGYKTKQLQNEPITTTDWTGHFNRNSASVYLKLSATI